MQLVAAEKELRAPTELRTHCIRVVYHDSEAHNYSTKTRPLISNAKFIYNYARCWLSQAVPYLYTEGEAS